MQSFYFLILKTDHFKSFLSFLKKLKLKAIFWDTYGRNICWLFYIHARHTTPWSRLAVKDYIKIAGKQRYGMLLWYYISKLKWTDFSWRLNQFYFRFVFAYMFRILDTWKYQKISKNYSLNFFNKFLYVPLELYMGCVCHYSKLWS